LVSWLDFGWVSVACESTLDLKSFKARTPPWVCRNSNKNYLIQT
jgi:hypothetical protein